VSWGHTHNGKGGDGVAFDISAELVQLEEDEEGGDS